MNSNGEKNLIGALTGSQTFHEYERAFSDTTGLPLGLRPVETWQLPLHGKRCESPFCGMMAEKSRTCAACLQMQESLSHISAGEASKTATCSYGLSDTAVPVRLGDKLVGFLQTGQVFTKKPTEAQFERTARQVAEMGVETDKRKLKDAYFKTAVVPPKQYQASVKMLEIFAQHLAMVSNQVVIQQENSEPPSITRAKEFIREHHADDLSLTSVARAVNMSSFYFCKMFKKVTGVNFTDFLSRVRIEKAKNLLLNPNLRISEIAYEVGFQSLTHFNRVFKRIIGHSPTEYRDKLRTI